MIDKTLEQVVIEAVVSAAVGAATSAVIALIINKLLVRIIYYWLIGVSAVILGLGLLLWTSLNKITYWWVVGGFLGVIITFAIYKRYYDYPLKKWRVTNNEGGNAGVTRDQKDNPGLLAATSAFEGIPIGKAWMFKAKAIEGHAIWGPYIDFLKRGRYKAVFRVKVLGNVGKTKREISIITVDVASCVNSLGDNTIVKETLTSHFFRKANTYQKVHLDFRLHDKLSKIEFRVSSRGSEHIVILDYVKLSRRLF